MSVMKTLTINGRTFTVTPVVPADSVTLLASAWEAGDGKYHQVVELSGVTPHTKVDLQPTPKQLVEFHDKVLGFVAENDGGVVTVFAIGDKPTHDHTIQVTLTEVEATGKIRGNTVGTTMPRSDWSQTDPTKADYIKNKPTELGGTGNGSGQNATLYIGSDEPTGENRPLYWLDTSADAPVVPDEPEEPEAVTLVGIAASYTGGDVAVGTALDALTGITVTASYSDGSSKTVTGYSLSGEIVEGSNTITATYQGMTATFTVTGVASGGGELPDISTFVLDVPYLVSSVWVGDDASKSNNAALVAAGQPADNLPLTDYLSSDYAELYAVSFRPNASDPYGGPVGWQAYRYGHLGDNVPVWHEQTRIVNLSVSSTSGVDANRLKIHKLVRADILAALDGTEYTAEDIRAISQNVPNVGSKNHDVSVVWMAAMPTEVQQRAIISYFEQGGTV